MNAIVIYKSKTGYTKKYAEWLAKDLSADIFEASKVNLDNLRAYDTVVFGGSLHAIGISGIKVIKDNFAQLRDKKIIVFATGASLPKEKVITEVTNRNFTPEQQKNIRFFYLRGGFDYSRLPFFDKVLMLLLKKSIMNKKKKGKELSSDEAGMLAIYDQPVDYTREENIAEIIDYVRSIT
jgi:menaquinone-dependent protoporphyrinogen IX oxidase